ncbi:MAG TPA: cobaltochelatase subunit CobN, partial [Planctomycetota bacterium]|nr:cobaltochelatase subunit CobN [Planctomycetota bacterium]
MDTGSVRRTGPRVAARALRVAWQTLASVSRASRIMRVVRAAAGACAVVAVVAGLISRVSAQEPAARGTAPARVGFAGVWDRALPLIERASRETGVPVRCLDPQAAMQPGALDGLRVLYVLNIEAADVPGLAAALESARATDAALAVVPLDQRDAHAALEHRGLLHADDKVPAYWRANGPLNVRRLLQYTAITYLGAAGEAEPPVVVPDRGYYAPERREEALSREEALAHEESLRHDDPAHGIAAHHAAAHGVVMGDTAGATAGVEAAPLAAVLIHASFWVTGDTKVVDAEVLALRAQGFRVVTPFGDSAAWFAQELEQLAPAVIVEDRHGSLWENAGGKPLLERLDVPYLRPISMLGSTIDAWRADPKGLGFTDVGLFLTLQESRGTIEPIVVGGLQAGISGYRLHEPIPERVETFAARARAWTDLRRTPNADKRVAILYYNTTLGKDDLMRGSPTGAFLDGPQSLVRFLPRLAERGWQVDGAPRDVDALIARLRAEGSNCGPWNPGGLQALADRPGAVLVPAERYRQWFESRLDARRREEVVAAFGPPPGRFMVVERGGSPYLVLPVVDLGHVILAPQPARGERQDTALLHSRDVPPPHNYLALYWWLQEEFGADAIVHWGTHGTLEFLPGKETGLAEDDWTSTCIGDVPVLNPWIMDNVAEATISRRRSCTLLVDHQNPPSVAAGLTDGLHEVHEDIDKFGTLEPGLLREQFRTQIAAGVRRERLDATLAIAGLDARGLTDAEIGAVSEYLHRVAEEATPTSLHVLGVPPDDERIAPYLLTILRRRFLDKLAALDPSDDGTRHVQEPRDAEPAAAPHDDSGRHGPDHDDADRHDADRVAADHHADRHDADHPYADGLPGHDDANLHARALAFVKECVLGDVPPRPELVEDRDFARGVLADLRRADDEIVRLLDGLEGRFVPPGPGPDPARNPASVPSGRDLYGLNPEEIPTQASWEVAVKLVDEMLAHGQPRKLGFDLNGMETMCDYGVLEAQILYALGVRPVWDESRLAIDVALIPREELGRPRLDVFVAMGGDYKENFPTRVKLIDRAVRLASAADEADNLVRAGTESNRRGLLARGFSEARATELSVARVFGTKPGNLDGTNILYLVPRSGVWESDDEILSVYVSSMSYVYTGDLWGSPIDGLYETAIQGTDTIVRNWSSNMMSQLDNHHAYEYFGGLSMAVTKLTGRSPQALIADVRDPDGARMRSFEEVLATNLRTELLNRAWIEGMKEHGYAGAGHMAELVKNTFGWDVVRDGAVSDG